VLGDEDRVIAPRRLAAVVLRLGGSEALVDQVAGLLHHVRESPGLQVGQLASCEAELSTEGRSGEAAEKFVEVDQQRKQP
jgi:hypothetical protein